MNSLYAVLAVGSALIYASVVLLLWWNQEHIVFQPPSRVPHALGGATRIEYEAADGCRLFAYLVGEPVEPGGTLIIAFHGNADLARWLIPWATTAARVADACIMLPEYRGYDGITGKPTYETSALDAWAAWHCATKTLGVPAPNIVLYGHSLGSAIAAELAAELVAAESPRALVLVSPFSSARAMAGRLLVPGLTAFWRIISRVHFDTVSRVRSLGVRVSVAHGARDMKIPISMGRAVFAAAAYQGEFLAVPGAGHNDVPEIAAHAYWAWLARVIETPIASRVTRSAEAGTRREP